MIPPLFIEPKYFEILIPYLSPYDLAICRLVSRRFSEWITDEVLCSRIECLDRRLVSFLERHRSNLKDPPSNIFQMLRTCNSIDFSLVRSLPYRKEALEKNDSHYVSFLQKHLSSSSPLVSLRLETLSVARENSQYFQTEDKTIADMFASTYEKVSKMPNQATLTQLSLKSLPSSLRSLFLKSCVLTDIDELNRPKNLEHLTIRFCLLHGEEADKRFRTFAENAIKLKSLEFNGNYVLKKTNRYHEISLSGISSVFLEKLAFSIGSLHSNLLGDVPSLQELELLPYGSLQDKIVIDLPKKLTSLRVSNTQNLELRNITPSSQFAALILKNSSTPLSLQKLNLTTLELNNIRDKIGGKLSELPSTLKVLRLIDVKFTGKELALYNLKNLQELVLEGSMPRMSFANPKLEVLSLINNTATEQEPSILNSLSRSLRTLHLTKMPWKTLDMQGFSLETLSLRSMSQLKEVKLDSKQLKQIDAYDCFHFKTLELAVDARVNQSKCSISTIVIAKNPAKRQKLDKSSVH